MSEIMTGFSGKPHYRSSIPKTERWRNIKIGSKIHIMTKEEILEHYGSFSGVKGFTFYAGQIEEIEQKYLGKKFSINKVLLERIGSFSYESEIVYQPVVDGSRVYFPLSIFIIDDEGVENFPKPQEPKEKKVKYNIRILDKKQEIIEEMISKVDKETFRIMLSLGMKNNELACLNAVDMYLRKWAEQKYEYYLMFDKNLYIKKDIDFHMSDESMERLINSLLNKYDVYGMILNTFQTKDYIDNVCPENKILEDFCEGYKKGMKLSKFLSKYLNDVKFDIDYSKVLQDKNMKTSLFISIDPCDFMTVSINKHNWKSCHNTADGLYKSAPYSLMLDEASLVGFVSKGNLVEYELKGHKFKWNSKQSRLMINIDKNTGAMSFNKPYPNMNDSVQKESRYLMEETMSKYLGVSNEWLVQKDNNQGYIKASGNYHYTDPMYYNVIHSTMDNKHTEDVEFNIGSPFIYCCECGEKVVGDAHNYVKEWNMRCRHCYEKRTSSSLSA